MNSSFDNLHFVREQKGKNVQDFSAFTVDLQMIRKMCKSDYSAIMQ